MKTQPSVDDETVHQISSSTIEVRSGKPSETEVVPAESEAKPVNAGDELLSDLTQLAEQWKRLSLNDTYNFSEHAAGREEQASDCASDLEYTLKRWYDAAQPPASSEKPVNERSSVVRWLREADHEPIIAELSTGTWWIDDVLRAAAHAIERGEHVTARPPAASPVEGDAGIEIALMNAQVLASHARAGEALSDGDQERLWLAAEVRRLREENERMQEAAVAFGDDLSVHPTSAYATLCLDRDRLRDECDRLAQQVSDLTEQMQSMIEQAQRDEGQ